MLGRTKDQIRTKEQVNAASNACQTLKLDGLVIIGGTIIAWSMSTIKNFFILNSSYSVPFFLMKVSHPIPMQLSLLRPLQNQSAKRRSLSHTLSHKLSLYIIGEFSPQSGNMGGSVEPIKHSSILPSGKRITPHVNFQQTQSDTHQNCPHCWISPLYWLCF